jgi:hypothetical protein
VQAIWRDLTLAPWHSTPADRRIGLYLFLLAFGYSIPLWVHSIWVEIHRGLPAEKEDGWARAGVRALAYAAAFATILVLRSKTSLDFIYFQF